MLTWLLCKTRSKCRFSGTRVCVCGGHDSPITWEQEQEALLQLLTPTPREAWVPPEAARQVTEEVGGDRGVEGQGHGGEGSACGLAAWA